MPEVVVIGGGLSGLAAAWELETLRIPYTLIEVKPRLGGSIVSARQNNYVLDGAAFMFRYLPDQWAFLAELGLADALFSVHEQMDGRDQRATFAGFKAGTQTLIDALAQRLTAPRLMRMAVSSLGYRNGENDAQGFAICMENGMVLDARALIVAVPARYAERLFYTLEPQLGALLLAHRYDHLVRLSLGYPRAAVELPPWLPEDVAFPFALWTDHPARVPDGQVLLQIGIRVNAAHVPPESLAGSVLARLGWETALVQRVHTWSEADSLSAHEDGFEDWLAQVRALLPPGIALVGSDYLRHTRPDDPALPGRVAGGRAAAQQIAGYLAGR